MKGFKPTGYGPSAGFKYPTKMGFTGSTGRVTTVQPYIRRKHFADGGFVREDNPRMKQETIGDQGSSMVRRKRAYAKWEDDAGAHSSLLPGYKSGGSAKKPQGAYGWDMKKGGRAKKKMRKADGGAISNASGMGALSNAGRAAMERAKQKQKPKPPQKAVAITKERFYEDGGSVPRHKSNPSVWDGIKNIPALVKEVPNLMADAGQRMMSRAQRDVATTKRRRIDAMSDGDDLASNYKRGGKAKRMGYALGGAPIGRMVDQIGRGAPARMVAAPPQRPMPQRPIMNIPRPPMRGMYAKGGAVSAGEAKKIAERTVGEHVRYKAPLGHKGLGKMIAQRR